MAARDGSLGPSQLRSLGELSSAGRQVRSLDELSSAGRQAIAEMIQTVARMEAARDEEGDDSAF